MGSVGKSSRSATEANRSHNNVELRHDNVALQVLRMDREGEHGGRRL